MEYEHFEKKKGFLKGYFLGILTVILVLVFAYGLLRISSPRSLSLRQNIKVFVKLNEVASLVNQYYLEETDQQKMLDGAFDGYMQTLEDPYSRYYTPEQYQEYLESTSGSFVGIGVTVEWNEEEKRLVVLEVQKGSPAEQGGILPGDEICEVDGALTENMDMNETISKVKGKIGTEVALKVVREGFDEPVSVTCIRGKIEEETVSWQMLENQTGYIALSGFREVTTAQFENAFEELKEQGMTGLILDLRGNPGGRLDVVVAIADKLLPEGIITYTLDKNEQRKEFSSDAGSILEVPLVVLIDEDSASASEILAGAVRDHAIGTLVGKTTFGKGIVQTTYSLGDGSAVKMTMARYYTPNGDYIHKKGIAPDVEAALPEGTTLGEVRLGENDTQFQKAMEVLDALRTAE